MAVLNAYFEGDLSNVRVRVVVVRVVVSAGTPFPILRYPDPQVPTSSSEVLTPEISGTTPDYLGWM